MSGEREALLAELREAGLRTGSAVAAAVEGLSEDEAAGKALAILGEAGLLAWTVAAAHGGATTRSLAAADAVSVRALCALRGALAYHSGFADVMFVMQGLGSHPIALAGSRELRDLVLPRVVKGELVSAFALTEPGAGSDLGMIAMRAEAIAGSPRRWRLTGTKTFISNAGLADFYCVLARTSGECGDGGRSSLTMFHVPARSRGVAVQRFEVMAPHPIGDVVLDGVEVGDADRLGREGDGLDVALTTLSRFRTSVAAAANGFARRALDESIAHLKQREQFGKPLSAAQGLRFELAEMDTRLRAAELLVEEAAGLADRGERASAEVARAKLFATENASWVCDRAVQHLGGLGVKRGSVVERLYREVRALRIYEGTSEIQKLILARELLER